MTATQASGYALVIALLLALSGCMTQPQLGTPEHPGVTLDQWVETELIPYLSVTLSEHPRLRNQSLAVVRISGADIQPRIDGLTRDLRQRLTDILAGSQGVRMAWLPSGETQHHRRLSGADCDDPLRTGYFIGIESNARPDGSWRIAVRILDAREQAWVNGLGLAWNGHLNQSQLQALGNSSEDELLRGLRVLPFAGAQADLAAAYFANNLSCLLRQRGLSESRLHLTPPPEAPPRLQTLVALVDNYLSRLHQVRIVVQKEAADYLLETEIHRIDQDLFQLWIGLRPARSAEQVAGLDTSAYVRLGAAVASAGGGESLAADNRASITELQLLQSATGDACLGSPSAGLAARTAEPGASLSASDCYQVRAHGNGRLFVLFHRPDGVLVHLDPGYCPNPILRLNGTPGVGTLYALAVQEGPQSRRIRELVERLPDTCHPVARSRGSDTGTWVRELEQVIALRPEATSWSAVRYRFR